MTAFLLEAGFLGVMLFGWETIGRGAHFAPTVLAAVGTLILTLWIPSSNSWMQTPQGFTVENGPRGAAGLVQDHLFPYRLSHVAIATFIVVALIMADTGAWHLLKGRRDPALKTV